MKLVEAFDKHNCDKGSEKHRYDRVYEPAFDAMNGIFSLLEIGILEGMGMKSILSYAPNSTIIGIDTFERVPPQDIDILNHPNVGWVQCSSLDKPNDEMMELVPPDGFDIIIDDGLHTHDAQIQTFTNYFPLLRKSGVYFIEDVWAFEGEEVRQLPARPGICEVFNNVNIRVHWLANHPGDWTDEKYAKLLKTVSAAGTVVKHDLREGHEPDSFIIEVRK